jgi:hypothetical protein
LQVCSTFGLHEISHNDVRCHGNDVVTEKRVVNEYLGCDSGIPNATTASRASLLLVFEQDNK